MKKMFLVMAMLFSYATLTPTYAAMSYSCYAKFGEDHPLLSGSTNVSADSNAEAVQKAYKWYKDNYPDVTVINVTCK